MIKKFNEYINESLTDKMLSKSDDEVMLGLEKLSPRTALDRAIVMGFLDGVKKTLPRLHANQHWLDYGVRRAAENGHVDVVKFFIEEGADNSDVALNIAFLNGHLEVFKYLLKQGADINTLPTTRFDVYLPPDQKEKFREVFKEYGVLDESLRDQMKPKSNDEIKTLLGDLDIDIDKEISVKIWNPYNHTLVSSSSSIKQTNIDKDYSKLTGDFMKIYDYMQDYYHTLTPTSTIAKLKRNLIKESLRDKMKGKSEEEFWNAFNNSNIIDKFLAVKRYKLSDEFLPTEEEIKKDISYKGYEKTNNIEIVKKLDQYNNILGVNSYFGILEYFVSHFDNDFVKNSLIQILKSEYPSLYDEIINDIKNSIDDDKNYNILNALWEYIEGNKYEDYYDDILLKIINLYDKNKLINLAIEYAQNILGTDR